LKLKEPKVGVLQFKCKQNVDHPAHLFHVHRTSVIFNMPE